AAAGDPGAVHEDVEGAELRLDPGRQGAALLQVVDRGAVRVTPRARGLDVGDGLARGLLVAPVGDGHRGAAGGQGQGDRPADAPAASGDQRGASGERTHTGSFVRGLPRQGATSPQGPEGAEATSPYPARSRAPDVSGP